MAASAIIDKPDARYVSAVGYDIDEHAVQQEIWLLFAVGGVLRCGSVCHNKEYGCNEYIFHVYCLCLGVF
jgi:hypothetical protein